jgi:hypothetical protein
VEALTERLQALLRPPSLDSLLNRPLAPLLASPLPSNPGGARGPESPTPMRAPPLSAPPPSAAVGGFRFAAACWLAKDGREGGGSGAPTPAAPDAAPPRPAAPAFTPSWKAPLSPLFSPALVAAMTSARGAVLAGAAAKRSAGSGEKSGSAGSPTGSAFSARTTPLSFGGGGGAGSSPLLAARGPTPPRLDLLDEEGAASGGARSGAPSPTMASIAAGAVANILLGVPTEGLFPPSGRGSPFTAAVTAGRGAAAGGATGGT